MRLGARGTCVASTAVIESAPSVRLHENLGLPSASEFRLSTFGNAERRESDYFCQGLESAAEHMRSLSHTPSRQAKRRAPSGRTAHPQRHLAVAARRLQ